MTATPFGKRLIARPPSRYAYPFSLSLEGDNQQTVESAIASYQGRVQQHPADGLDRAALAGAYLKMARVTGAANWYLLAEQEARQSLTNLPFNNDGAVMVLAEIAQAKHEFAEAVRLAEQVSGAKSLTVVVTSKLAMGQLAAAETAADEMVDFVPSLGSLSLRGLTRMARGDHQGALLDFQQAIAAEEPSEQRGSAQIRTFLGRLYAEQGKSEQAEQLYREALKIVPDYPLALLHLAQLETRSGDYRAANRYYSQLSTSVASQGVALQGIARIRSLQGKAAEAEWQSAETVLRQQLDDNALGHRRDLAHLLLERGRDRDVAEAIALMQTETQNRRDAETLDILAWALSRAGRWQEAQAAIRKALDQGVRNAGILYRAAEIETALSHPDQAEKYIRSAQALDPSFDQQTRQRLGLVAQK
ncbi:tetratricopeptide repeat protein [Leptolyngbya sp. BC1307]|uniref:tetratricopeptide repeat protein n=1 Tax=Leptolyngbya sp. BC1307 TaxID=2029589 RepID=UPI001483BCFA|nr:tetratricopeptide repeat protein [Leptolyngbya sp. BC1307]